MAHDTVHFNKISGINGTYVGPKGSEIQTADTSGHLYHGGTELTPTAAQINKLASVTATAADLELTKGATATVAITAAAGASNVSNVTFTVKDAAGATIAAVHHLDIWLSDAATGQGLTGTTASGTVQAKAASGTDLQVYSAKKALRVQTLATGVYVLEITDSAKSGFYPCAIIPLSGRAVVGAQLASNKYGA